MAYLITGLVLFLVSHLAVAVPGFKRQIIETRGYAFWKIGISLISLVALTLIIYGFSLYRAEGYISLWEPPLFLRHVALVLNLPVFIFIAAAFLPGRIKAALKHPILAGVKLWALAHLLANGDLGSVLLFGTFLIWAVIARIAAKRREALLSPLDRSGPRSNDLMAVLIGLVAYLIMLKYLHIVLIGVLPV